MPLETLDALRVMIIDSDIAMCKELHEAFRSRVNEPPAIADLASALDRGATFGPDVVCAKSPSTDREKTLLTEFRAHCAATPIVGYSETDDGRNGLLRSGNVDLAVNVSDMHGPWAITILDDAIRLHRARDRDEREWAEQAPLRDSKTFGSIVATATGVVQSANTCIAKWLGYPDPSYLVGVNFPRRHLKRPSEWNRLSKAVSLPDTSIKAELPGRDVDGRWLAFTFEASAKVECRGLVRLLILDETEKELLKATLELHFEKARVGNGAVQ